MKKLILLLLCVSTILVAAKNIDSIVINQDKEMAHSISILQDEDDLPDQH